MTRILLVLLVCALGCRPRLPAPVAPLSATPRDALVASMPPVSFEPAVAPAVFSHVLANGLQLHVIPLAGARSVAIQYALRRAAEDGSLGPMGSASFSLELATDRDALAAAFSSDPPLLSSSTSVSGGYLSLSTDVVGLEAALRGLAHLAQTTGFDAERIRRQAQTHFDALDDSSGDVFGQARRHAHRLLYGERSVLGQNPVDMFKTVETLNVSELEGRHQQLFAPASSALIVCGDVQPEAVRSLVEEQLGRLRPPAVPAAPKRSDLGTPPATRTRVLLLPGRYARIVQAFPAPAADSRQRVAFEALSFVAAASTSSRVDKQLRERAGQTYHVGGSYQPRREGGTWLLEAIVDPKRINYALRIVDTELARLRNEPVSNAELTRVRTQLRERRRASLSDVDDTASLAAQAFLLSPEGSLLDLQRSWDEYYAAIDQVSALDLRELAQRYVTDRLRGLVVAGDIRPYLGGWHFKERDFDLFVLERSEATSREPADEPP
ncbi:MAG TPA: insulinase family protein [Polyangiales bacterium]